MEFHERLKKLREEKCVKQRELGNVLEYGYTTISNYESGRNQPSIEDLKKIARYFDVSLDYLLCASDLRREFDDRKGPELIQQIEIIYYSADSNSKKLLTNIVQLILKLTPHP